jgi:hypothetical protein
VTVKADTGVADGGAVQESADNAKADTVIAQKKTKARAGTF